MSHHVSKSRILLIITSFSAFLVICWLLFGETVKENWRIFQAEKPESYSETQEVDGSAETAKV